LISRRLAVAGAAALAAALPAAAAHATVPVIAHVEAGLGLDAASDIHKAGDFEGDVSRAAAGMGLRLGVDVGVATAGAGIDRALGAHGSGDVYMFVLAGLAPRLTPRLQLELTGELGRHDHLGVAGPLSSYVVTNADVTTSFVGLRAGLWFTADAIGRWQVGAHTILRSDLGQKPARVQVEYDCWPILSACESPRVGSAEMLEVGGTSLAVVASVRMSF